MPLGKNHTCTLCGKRITGFSYYHEDKGKDKDLYLCIDCLKSATKSLTRVQLLDMTAKQLRRHMEVRDELAATYKNLFVATKTFCVGKRRDVPILEVDEKHELWALPKVSMPLAQPIASIADVEVTLSSEELVEGDGLKEEIVEGVQVKDLMPLVHSFIGSRYKSKNTYLAPIPEGQFVSLLHLILTLDDQESGMTKAVIDLLPFWLSLPSRVDAGYDCAHDIIEFLKQLASTAYKKRRASGKDHTLSCNDRLSILAARKLIADDDAEVLRYYVERVPRQSKAKAVGSSYSLVRAVIDTVADNLVCGEKAPDLKTLHTVGYETFLGAFYRYAPGLSVSDVVCIMDNTTIQSGKGGMLFAQESFAVDDFTRDLEESVELIQPIPYDDLLFVGIGEGKDQLVLAYKDGRRIRVNSGAYAHFIFAAVNCILFLRP